MRAWLPDGVKLVQVIHDEGKLRAVLPFPTVKLDAGEPVVPPREYATVRRPETLAA